AEKQKPVAQLPSAAPLPSPLAVSAQPVQSVAPVKTRFLLKYKFPAQAGSGSGEFGGQFGDDFVFSPNGRWMAVRDREADNETIRVWDLDTGTSIWKIDRRKRPIMYFDFSPDSRWFVVAGGD